MNNDLNLTELGVSPRANFRCLAMTTRVSSDLIEPLTIEPGLLVLFQTPFKVDQSWTESLGTFHDQKLANSTLLLMSFSEEMALPELDRRVFALWYALLIQGQAYSVEGLKLGGHNTGNGLHFKSGGSLPDYHPSPKVVWDSVKAGSLKRAAEIARSIQTIFSRQDDESHYLRLRKGLNALLRGIREETDADFRLHRLLEPSRP